MIRRKHVGAVTEAVFREWVEPLLRESVSAGGAPDVQQAAGRTPQATGRQENGRSREAWHVARWALVPAADGTGPVDRFPR